MGVWVLGCTVREARYSVERFAQPEFGVDGGVRVVPVTRHDERLGSSRHRGPKLGEDLHSALEIGKCV
jgi:hypothetical protein